MMKQIKIILRNYFPAFCYRFSQSYAQDGEDMIVKALYEHIKNYKGFFVDVGAHHPIRYSNTNYFYRRGWRGINIEPTPNGIDAFKRYRRRDINLNFGIGTERGVLKFFCFNEPALNTFSKEVSERIDQDASKYKIIGVLDVDVLPLGEVLDRHLPDGQCIDFLTIDVEGLDFQVLKSNNWEKYKPEVILIEDRLSIDSIGDSPIYQFLKEKQYELFAKTLRTCIYRLKH